MRISALLNHDTEIPPPRCSPIARGQNQRGTSSDAYPPNEAQVPSTVKKPKGVREVKDAAKFERGPVMGEINFPPFETEDEELRRKQNKLQVFPERGIADFPRHIPYSSDKKEFQIQTGRGSFEVFQYTFKYNGGGKDWTVMWDYNIGLVRITPFFKALGFAKTIPAKAIGKNPGLREMCHSITGGALAAQGYWMPFEAAKSLAANFCWEIRHALTPVFGPDFLNLCVRPNDEAYSSFAMDSTIITACQKEVRGWTQSLNTTTSRVKRLRSRIATDTSTEVNEEETSPKTLRSRTKRIYNVDDNDDDFSDAAESQQTPVAGRAFRMPRWNAVNLPASPAPSLSMTSPSPVLSSAQSQASSTAKRTYSDRENDADVSADEVSESDGKGKRRKIGVFSVEEARAAYLLLQLSVGACGQC